jgi:hypothetical protein
MVSRGGRGRRGGDKWKAKDRSVEAKHRHDRGKGQIALAKEFELEEPVFVLNSNGRLGSSGVVKHVDHRVHVKHPHLRNWVDYHPTDLIRASQVNQVNL